jgi:hypothetical protein
MVSILDRRYYHEKRFWGYALDSGAYNMLYFAP